MGGGGAVRTPALPKFSVTSIGCGQADFSFLNTPSMWLLSSLFLAPGLL